MRVNEDSRSNSRSWQWLNHRPLLSETLGHYQFTSIELLWSLALGLAACFPIMGGRVFLLDWVVNTHTSVLGPSLLGLNGGLTASALGGVVFTALNSLIGSAATWLPLFVFFPVAALGAGRLTGGSSWARIAAGSLFAVNPFVFNRVFVGHVALLVGYALLPYAVGALLVSPHRTVLFWPIPALWWAVLTGFSPHFAWIYGVVVAGVFIVELFSHSVARRRLSLWFLFVLGAFSAMSAYLLLPHFVTRLSTQLGTTSLNLYQTTPDPHWGLYFNVASLYGFWRLGPGPVLAKSVLLGWPLFMVAILAVVFTGASVALRRQKLNSGNTASSMVNPTTSERVLLKHSSAGNERTLQGERRRLAPLLVIVGVGGYFLSLGSQGPTGWLFTWSYRHVPFFALMREPQKFLMLLALSYAVFFGWGVERLRERGLATSNRSQTLVLALVAVALPLSYTSTMFWGLDGQIASSTVPGSYQRADAMMGNGPGQILALPWHLYMSYPFTSNRVVANIAPSSFRRSVISGDNVQSQGVATQSTSPRSAYLQQLFADGNQLHFFGALVAPLGVRYVILEKSVDWRAYAWLDQQKDLTKVFNTSSLEVWRNNDFRGVGGGARRLTKIASLSTLFARANAKNIGVGAVIYAKASGTFGAPSLGKNAKSSLASATTSTRRVQELSPVAYRIAKGPPSWVNVDTPYQEGWSLNGRPARPSAEGTTLIWAPRGGGVLVFTPWRMARLGFLLSLGIFAALLGVVAVGNRNRRRERRASLGETG